VDLADLIDCADLVDLVDLADLTERRLKRLFVDVLIDDLEELTDVIPDLVDEVERPRDVLRVAPMPRGVVDRPRLTLRAAALLDLAVRLFASLNSILILVNELLRFFISCFIFMS